MNVEDFYTQHVLSIIDRKQMEVWVKQEIINPCIQCFEFVKNVKIKHLKYSGSMNIDSEITLLFVLDKNKFDKEIFDQYIKHLIWWVRTVYPTHPKLITISVIK